MTRIKICGITNLDDALAASMAGIHALGFNFSKSSPRYIHPKDARKIIDGLPPFVSCVGVFVEQEPAEINAICKNCNLDLAQLHSERYTPETALAITSTKVIRVFRAGPDFSMKEVIMFAEKTGFRSFLFDAYRPDQAGGTGTTIAKQTAQKIFRKMESIGHGILAGGLNPLNVTEAIRTVKPYAVDTASGVEESPGKKDHQKIIDFVDAVKKADKTPTES